MTTVVLVLLALVAGVHALVLHKLLARGSALEARLEDVAFRLDARIDVLEADHHAECHHSETRFTGAETQIAELQERVRIKHFKNTLGRQRLHAITARLQNRARLRRQREQERQAAAEAAASASENKG